MIHRNLRVHSLPTIDNPSIRRNKKAKETLIGSLPLFQYESRADPYSKSPYLFRKKPDINPTGKGMKALQQRGNE